MVEDDSDFDPDVLLLPALRDIAKQLEPRSGGGGALLKKEKI